MFNKKFYSSVNLRSKDLKDFLAEVAYHIEQMEKVSISSETINYLVDTYNVDDLYIQKMTVVDKDCERFYEGLTEVFNLPSFSILKDDKALEEYANPGEYVDARDEPCKVIKVFGQNEIELETITSSRRINYKYDQDGFDEEILSIDFESSRQAALQVLENVLDFYDSRLPSIQIVFTDYSTTTLSTEVEYRKLMETLRGLINLNLSYN